MPSSFRNILLVSDLDGTLIGDDFQVPQKNLNALRRFQQRGGRFAIATGRAIESAERYVTLTHPNAPCIVLNGSMIYDYAQHKVMWGCPLPPGAAAFVRQIMERFPEVGIEICTDEAIHVIRENPLIQGHLSHEGIPHRECTMEQTAGEWYKVFFAMEESRMPQLKAFTESFSHNGVRFVPSSRTYFEMLPEAADKGLALRKLVHLLGLRQEDSVAVGDYYNDMELLSSAGAAIVPENAPGEIQQLASHVVCHCRLGAVAEAIEWIERRMQI